MTPRIRNGTLQMTASHPFLQLRMRTAADEAAAPKYAHSEIERRWLVDSTRLEVLDAVEPIAILDRYIEGTRFRLREMRRGEDVVWKLTKKYECADPLVRPIVTGYLTSEEYDIFARLSALTLAKRRYRLSHAGHDFSLDRFSGNLEGLTLAELEVADEAALRALPNPPWTVRDITDDARYQGATLARNGLPVE